MNICVQDRDEAKIMKQPSILLLAGEASGDYHAAAMVKDLKQLSPDIHVVGIGGDKLAQAGMESIYHYRDINTIGLSGGFAKIHNIVKAYRKMKQEITSGRHQLFVPVDFPDVNLRLCSVAKKARIPVCYYISPQVWAWRKGRLRTIAARVNRMMTIFPFEAELYRTAGLRADFVGHTMVKDIPARVDKHELRKEFGVDPSRSVTALVPGSRQTEIIRMLPVMCEAARMYSRKYPDALFLLPLASPHLAELVHNILESYDIRVSVHNIEAARLMAACDSGLVTSGTATLQAALAGMPHVVAYKLDSFSWILASKILKPLVMEEDIHVAIANVLAIKSEKQGGGPIKEMIDSGYHVACQECGRPLFVPELLQDKASPENLAEWLVRFRSEDGLRAAMVRGFDQLRRMLEPEQPSLTPAAVIMECLQGRA